MYWRSGWVQLVFVVLTLIAVSLFRFSTAAHAQEKSAAVHAAATEATSFYNPIVPDLADPSVLLYNGFYYFTYSDVSNNIYVMKSSQLSRLGDGAVATVWTHPASGDSCCEVWAPELKLINGTFYIYFAADDGNNNNHRMYTLQADTGDPQGSYTFRGKVSAPTDRWAIDGIPVQQGSSLYFLWSGWDSFDNVQQNLYIAPMSNPYTISGERVLISAPDQSWEQVTGPLHINEAPQALYRNGKIFVTYSANGSTTDEYCLGMLTASDSANLLDPNSWSKSNGPVFSKVDTAYGPGTNAFTTSPDGTQDWLVYNATVLSGNGSTDNWKNRSIRAQQFTWDSNGNPVFGSPALITTPLARPSGEQPTTLRYEAELAKINDAFINTRTGEHTTRQAASHDQDVGRIDNPDSYVEFTVTMTNAGTYTVTEGYSNGFNVTASHNVIVNGQSGGLTTLPGTGAWNSYGTASIQVNLNAGDNTIRLAKGDNWAEIDYIELPM